MKRKELKKLLSHFLKANASLVRAELRSSIDVFRTMSLFPGHSERSESHANVGVASQAALPQDH
jgi:hypothetical protein